MEFVYKQSPAYLINILSRLFNQALSSRLSSHNTSPAQLPVLLSLWQKDGQTQSELCRRMRIEQPTLANTLKRMVRDKLIRKVPDTNDRRQTRIKLTQRGKELKPILTQSALEVHDAAMKGITEPGQETMLLMISKIISNLDNDLSESPLVLDDSVLEMIVEPVQDAELEPVQIDPATDDDANPEVQDEPNKIVDDDDDMLILRDIDIVRD